jgi:hypothetical protein
LLDERCNAFDVVRPSLHGRVADEREQLSTTFDSAADLYQQARPDYPEAIVDTLVETTGVSAIGSSKSDALAGQPRSPLLVEAFGSLHRDRPRPCRRSTQPGRLPADDRDRRDLRDLAPTSR